MDFEIVTSDIHPDQKKIEGCKAKNIYFYRAITEEELDQRLLHTFPEL